MTTPTPESLPGTAGAGPTADAVDGRTTRWDAHRAARRAVLVTATLRAIRRHGAGVGMDDIASVAGTSKTVFYRHFGDRAGLYRAVADAVDARLLGQIQVALTSRQRSSEGAQRTSSAGRGKDLLRACVDEYLRLVEEDPAVYRFIVTAPLVPAKERSGSDPAVDVTDLMSARMADLVSAQLVAAGRPEREARTWGQAVVGLVRSVADQWLRAGASESGATREQVVDDVIDLLWTGLAPAWPTR